ncbi:MAG: hypothetical protein ACKVG7_06915 [Flavobacteriales bacterium]|tara:strand:+ start:782 stop:1069 length:288 start_codon:yes stop_codon:yes gene_type:complete
MKKSQKIGISLLLSIFLFACSESKMYDINGKTVLVQPYGLVDGGSIDGIIYEVSPTNILAAIIFAPTVVVPLYIVGWDLYEPQRCEGGYNCKELK